MSESNEYVGLRIVSCDSLSKDRVRSTSGEDLGKVKRLMVDVDTGRIAYAMISFGGILGVGDKLFAIPWNRVKIDTTNEELIADIDKRTLENSPGINDSHTMDPEEVEQYYRRQFGTEDTSGTRGRLTYGDAGSPSAGVGRPSDAPKERF